MTLNDEILMAFVDGELPDEEASAVRAAMADDRELTKRVERLRAVRRALRDTYDNVTQEPIPDRFHALLGKIAMKEPEQASPAPSAAPTAAPVVDLAAARAARPRFTPPVWAAMAACLLVGVLGARLIGSSSPSLMAEKDGQLRAGAALTRVLDTRLASDAENAKAALHIGVSFRAQDGAYCRTFDSIEASEDVSGLACRQNDGWVVRIATTEPAIAGDYRQAGSSAPAVLSMVDTMIAGDPLTQAQERAARDHSWR